MREGEWVLLHHHREVLRARKIWVNSMLGVSDEHEPSYTRSIRPCDGIEIHRGQEKPYYVQFDAWLCEAVSGLDNVNDVFGELGRVECLYPVNNARIGWVERRALDQGVRGLAVQSLLTLALGVLDASACTFAGIACQTSCGRRQNEFDSSLVG